MTSPRHALRYLKLGWSVLPLSNRGKLPDATCLPQIPDPETGELRPSWKPFQARHATRREIWHWHRTSPGGNVGIVTGTISGLVVLDLDSPAALAALGAERLPRTPTVQTAQGLHLYFAHPGATVSNRANLLPNAPGCDLRGDGGYVVAPPSVHPSGARYRWRIPPNRAPLAPLPAWLMEALTRPYGAIATTEVLWSGEAWASDEAASPDEPWQSHKAARSNESRYTSEPWQSHDAASPHEPAAPPVGFPAVRWQAYVEAAIRQELDSLCNAQVGERNHRLNCAAFALGQWVALGMIEANAVAGHLSTIAAGLGLPEREATRTIQSGLRAGQARPRRLPAWVQSTPPQHPRRAAATRRRW